jgi:epsin
MGCSLQFLYLFGFTCRFTWGSRVRKLSQRILKLLENGLFLQQKKKGAGARKFQGFGSFSQRSSSADESLKASDFRTWLTCNSNYSHQHNHAEDDEFMDSNEKLLFEETIQIHEDTSQPVLGNPVKISREEYTAEDHPFCDNLHHTTVSLLSASE